MDDVCTSDKVWVLQKGGWARIDCEEAFEVCLEAQPDSMTERQKYKACADEAKKKWHPDGRISSIFHPLTSLLQRT